MKNRVVISGIGAVSSHGNNIETICERSSDSLYATSNSSRAGKINILTVCDLEEAAVSNRLRKKIDPFTIYGLCASRMAINDSGLLDSDINLDRIGIFVGNCLGGWAFTEPELMKLHTVGVELMSAYVATAWFPAALQGQISLQYGFRGYSKTYSTSAVAGLQAIGYAVEAIQNGRADVIVCGASENVSNPYIHALLQTYDYGSEYRKSGYGCEKYVDFAEGAAFMVVESYEHAMMRGASIYCEITGFADHFCTSKVNREIVHSKNLEAAITQVGLDHLFVMDGMFIEEHDFTTNQSASHIETPLTTVETRHVFGNMFALAGVMEVACFAHDLKTGAVRANRFGALGSTSTEKMKNIIVRRLSKQGGMSSLTISAL